MTQTVEFLHSPLLTAEELDASEEIFVWLVEGNILPDHLTLFMQRVLDARLCSPTTHTKVFTQEELAQLLQAIR